MNKKFSVAMSVYKNDNPVHFDRALYSITTNQSIKPDEIVLIVDGPISEELDLIIKKYQQLYDIFNIIRFETNLGLGTALKVAVENSSNELIARMDSDDVAVHDRFEQQLKFFEENTDTDIIGGNITEFIDREDNIVGTRAVPDMENDIKEYIKKRCPFNHMTVMYKKTAVLKAGGYIDLFWDEDYYLWIRMLINGCNMANTGTILVNVRTGEDMYKRRGGKKYFQSELFLQKYLLKNKIISFPRYLINVYERLILQVLMPNKLRGWVFKKFARQKYA